MINIPLRSACLAAVIVMASLRVWAGVSDPEYLSLGNLNTEMITASPASAGAGPVGDSNYYFAASDPERGTEVWMWPGGGEAMMLADVRPGPESSNPSQFAPLSSGRAFFIADDGYNGPEPWVANSSGATKIGEVQPGNGHPAPVVLGSAGGWVWFSTPRTSGSVARTEIWATDGNSLLQTGVVDEGSITRVTTVANPASMLFVASPVGSGSSNLYCQRDDANLITVGQIRDSGTPALPSTPVYAATVGFVSFQRTDINAEPYVWSFSGSASVLKNIHSSGDSAPTHFVSNGTNTVCFAATTAANGRELWQTNGTTATTVLTSDTSSGAASSNPEPLPMRYNQPHLFFRTNIAGTPACWYVNTVVGSASRALVAPDVTGWLYPTMVGPSELLYFMPLGAQWQLMQVTDKSTFPFVMSAPHFTSVDSLFNHVRADDGTSRNPFMVGNYSFAGNELWKIGTSSVTVLDPGNGFASTNPRWISAQGTGSVPTLLFGGNTTTNQISLYKVPAGGGSINSVGLSDYPFSGDRSSFPADFTEMDNGLFFSAMAYTSEHQHFRGLWVTTGDHASTGRLTDIVHVEQLVRFQNRVYLLGRRVNDVSGKKELHYASIDLPNGHATVQRHPDSIGFEVTRLAAAAGKLFYVQQESNGTETLHCILPDFTEAHPAETFVKSSDGVGITQLTPSSGHLYFSAWASGGRRAWRTDGATPSESDHPTFVNPQFLGALGDSGIFFCDRGSNYQLRQWDAGTVAVQTGTFAINDPPRVGANGKPGGVVFDGSFYFTSGTGSLIYKTSISGTSTVYGSPNLAMRPEWMRTFGTKLFFLGNNSTLNTVLRSLDATGFVEFISPPGPPLLGGGFFTKSDGLYFGLSYTNQANLYKSDGTTMGTERIPAFYDLAMRNLSGYDLPMGTLRGHLVLPREDHVNGLEPAVINSRPAFGAPLPLTGLRNQPLTFTYEQIIPTPPTDGDGDPLVISISSVPSGVLSRNGGTYFNGDPISPGDTFSWEPPVDVHGPFFLFVLNADDGFTHGSLSIDAQIDSGFDIWNRAQFTPEELMDMSISAEWADPDSDGVTNGLEYIFGRQAKQGEAEPPVTTSVSTPPGGQPQMHLRFIRIASIPAGMKLIVQHTPSLLVPEGEFNAPWLPVNTKIENGPWSDAVNVTETPLIDGRVQVDVTLPVPLDGTTPGGFLRLRVEL